MDRTKRILIISTNVFVSGLYILQIQKISIASDSKNLLQFYYYKTVDMNIIYIYVLDLQNMWFIIENAM